jgi:ATP-dependent Clp protease ATP-binding subunit ClpL
MADQGITIKVNEDVKSYLVKNGYNPEYGARLVQRLIRREILAGLSKYLLQHPELNQVQLNMNGDMVQFHSYKLTKQAA